jgi:hypothetical protein
LENKGPERKEKISLLPDYELFDDISKTLVVAIFDKAASRMHFDHFTCKD